MNDIVASSSSGDRSVSFWKQSPLAGIFSKFGQNLPLVERVPGTLVISENLEREVTGSLIVEQFSLRLKFEAKALGAAFVTLQHKIRTAPHPAVIPIIVSGRAWVETDARIVLLVRSFEFQNLGKGGV